MAENSGKKPGFFAKVGGFFKRIAKSITKFFRDTKSEMKKVVWPGKKQVRNNTIVVIVVVLVAAAVILLLDFIFGGLLGLLL